MAKYKVDKKAFEERLLKEQLTQVELQSKYLKDEPLRRSEVDEYNKLKANGWVKNSLITLGVAFATAIAIIIFVLLGNMLMTNGRTGNVDANDLDSSAIFTSFVGSESFPDNSLTANNTLYIDYDVPGTFLIDVNDDVYITYRLEWHQAYDSSNIPVIGQGNWIVGRADGTYGYLTQSSTLGRDNSSYALDAENINLNNLMTDWFKGQEDGWAKSLIEDFFYTAWPLTLVFWLVFILAIAGYGVVLVVGIRYVIRSVIVVLRKGGYIVSDFITEVGEAIKAEIPIVADEVVEELDLSQMTKQLSQKLKDNKEKTDKEKAISYVELTPTAIEKEIEAPVKEVPVVKEETKPKKEGSEKTRDDKVKDIFNT